ncbi:hypothetical protein C7999DRAFT_36590 [Corynascus novoguineensis]|uniref:Uncharacterized protein n=1 Tax=Corynascus novoguineensis TaxID=1126955 RepID=A0AAN7CJ75_9PEZI|nr:hypothetical protein C7999DRAFT_36590 [Corynascus novoguineensis]
MAHIDLDRPDWLSELPSWIKEVAKLRKDIQGKQESADGITYDGSIQDRFKKLDDFINCCALSIWKTALRLRRERMWNALEAGLSDTESPETIEARRLPDSESPETKIYNTLKSMRKKCETAAHQFLRSSWNYDGKELDDVVRLMEELCHHDTNGDVGLDSLGAHEKAPVSADWEGAAEKPPYKDDAGLELRSSEQGIKLIRLDADGRRQGRDGA